MLPAGTSGAVELVLAGVHGGDTLLGHFTFVAGDKSRSFRYEGRMLPAPSGTLQLSRVPVR